MYEFTDRKIIRNLMADVKAIAQQTQSIPLFYTGNRKWRGDAVLQQIIGVIKRPAGLAAPEKRIDYRFDFSWLFEEFDTDFLASQVIGLNGVAGPFDDQIAIAEKTVSQCKDFGLPILILGMEGNVHNRKL